MSIKICRICISEARVKTVNIFQYNIGDNAATAFLTRMCDITVAEGDGLPAEICSKCLRSLKAAYKFKIQCELSNKILRGKLEQDRKQQQFCELPSLVKVEASDSPNKCEDQSVYNDGKVISSFSSCFSKLDNITANSRLQTHEQIPFKHDLKPQEKLQEIKEKFTSTTVPTAIIEQPVIKKIKARKNATCPVCYQKFEDYEDYRAHVRKHSGEVDKPYKCKACGKGFLCASQLSRHLYTHTDVKLYECSICKKGFNNAAHMKSHMYVHTGEKPYNCSVCNKGFNQMPHLKRHIQSHSKCQINIKPTT